MSNYDLLTPEENKIAATQGWSLEHVYDLALQRTRIQILPHWAKTGFKNAYDAGMFVVAHAKMLNPLHLKALRLLKKAL